MPRGVPKPPSNLSDPQRRLWNAMHGHYRVGRYLKAPGGSGRVQPVDRAKLEHDALFGHQASRLAERESFEHRFGPDAA